MTRLARIGPPLLAMSASMFCCVIGAEAVARRLDGYRVVSIAIRRSDTRQTSDVDGAPDQKYVNKIPRASGVSPDWYAERPQPASRIPLTAELRKRADAHPQDPFGAFFEWNLAFLQDQACKGIRAMTMGSLKDFYYFDSQSGSPYPVYRHLRHVSPPSWFVTNSFGWRGPDIALNKPENTIRLAFIGASTTVDRFAAPFSHPELVGYWLNRWAAAKALPYRFEVINAGRTGIDTHSIAAIVTQELLPVDPDMVIFYEGANQFWPGQVLSYQDSGSYRKPTATYRNRTAAEDYFALVRRIVRLAERLRAGDGGEPEKPASTVNWPAGVDEFDPPLDSTNLPMDLPAMVRDLDTIRTALDGIGSELVISSFVWIVHGGMRLDVDRDFTLHDYLNRSYWPVTYSEMRRLADFQNRVFEKYARTKELPFVDVAAEFPQDPALVVDAVHFRDPGLVLQGWIYLQRLIPLIEERLATGRLPRAREKTRSAHPAFDQPSPRLIEFDKLIANCR